MVANLTVTACLSRISIVGSDRERSEEGLPQNPTSPFQWDFTRPWTPKLA